jgi:two-component system response regulator MprA
VPRILVVDDDDEFRSIVEELLQLEGYTVTTARDGYQALSEVVRSRPDVIVSDVLMPPPDGIRLLEMLRSQGIRIPSILVSARTETRRHLADVLLTKPFRLDQLLEVIERLLAPEQHGPG